MCHSLFFKKEKKNENLMKILFLGFCVALHALGYITSTTTTTTTITIVSPTTTLCGCLFYFRLQITFLIYTNWFWCELCDNIANSKFESMLLTLTHTKKPETLIMCVCDWFYSNIYKNNNSKCTYHRHHHFPQQLNLGSKHQEVGGEPY